MRLRDQVTWSEEEMARLRLLTAIGDVDSSCVKCDVNWVSLQFYLKALGRICQLTMLDCDGRQVLAELAELLATVDREVRAIGGREDVEVGHMASYLAGVSGCDPPFRGRPL